MSESSRKENINTANERLKQRRKAWGEAGLCTTCGKRPPAEGRRTCRECLDRCSINNAKTYRRRKMREKIAAATNCEDDDFGAVLNCAVRYCIGRMTYMPKLVTDYIRPLLPYLTMRTLVVMENDVASAENYGMDMDKEVWMAFLDDVRKAMEKRRDEK